MKRIKPSMDALYQMLTYTAEAYNGSDDKWVQDEMTRLGMAIKGTGYALWGRHWREYLAARPIRCSWTVFHWNEVSVPQPTTI